jgi:hypothetical protein
VRVSIPPIFILPAHHFVSRPAPLLFFPPRPVQPLVSMGSSPSKPVEIQEKKPVQCSAQPLLTPATSDSFSSPGNHHATDRLLRISGEANLIRQNAPSTTTSLEKKNSMPVHETTHAEINLNALKAWDAVALDDPTSRLAAMTIHNTVIRDSIRRREAETADHHIFSHTIPSE